MLFVRNLFLCLPLICAGCQKVLPEHLQTFQDAQSAFDSQNYRQSATLYEKLLEQGIRSGTIYYNLGNAWAKADEPVRSVAAYYRARQYMPNDPHLNANLRAILADKGGTLQAESSLIGTIFFWQDSMGCTTKIDVSLLLAVLTFLGGVLCLRFRFRWLKRLTMGGALLTAIAIVSVGYDWYRFEGIDRVIVAMEVLPRKGNSEQYEPAFTSPLPFGTGAVILDDRSGWFLLRFSNGQEGWLPQAQTFRLE